MVAAPLSTNCMLLGVRTDTPCPAPDVFAIAAAEVWWDWFVASHDGPELAALTPRIGVRIRAFLEEAVRAGVREGGGCR